jgi:hypothetical protein
MRARFVRSLLVLFCLISSVILISQTVSQKTVLAASRDGSGGLAWGYGVLGHYGVRVVVGVGGGKRVVKPVRRMEASSTYYKYIECTECTINGEVCFPNGKLGLIAEPLDENPNPLTHLPPGDTVPYYVAVASTQTGQILRYVGKTVCLRSILPPPAPLPEVVWQYAPLPEPEIHFNPQRTGLTQLATWFWVSGDAGNMVLSRQIPGGIGGYAVTLVVHPVAYHWDFGDGSSADSAVAGGPGSSEDASVVHTYIEPGTYRVGLVVTWAGFYIYTGYGVTRMVNLGPVNQPQVFRPYTVQQVRGVLVPPNTSS